jgi:hypothetical protein
MKSDIVFILWFMPSVQTCLLYTMTSKNINFPTILITYYQILFGNIFYSC